MDLYQNFEGLNMSQLYAMYRYVYRMIERVNTTWGSPDGSKRISEVESLDLSRMSGFAKICLYAAVKDAWPDGMLYPENLFGLMKYGPSALDYPVMISAERSMQMDPFLYEYNIINGIGGTHMAGGFVNLGTFTKNLRLLNEVIDSLIGKGKLLPEYVFEIRCIGGFAMIYHDVRKDGLTEDIDSLVPIDDKIRMCIRHVAMKNSLPYDWINDEKHVTGMTVDSFTWEPTSILLSHIRLYVCSLNDLLRTKIGLAENHLNGQEEHANRKYGIDYQDTILILKKLGMEIGVSNPSYVANRMKMIGLNINDYPNIRKLIFYVDDPIDNMVWSTVYRCERDHDIRPLYQIMDELVMDVPSFMDIYGREDLSAFEYVKFVLIQKMNEIQ